MKLAQRPQVKRSTGVPTPKVGEAIFAGTDYPRGWDEFIGQRRAVEHLRAACESAKWRQQRLDHVLLASGAPGIGKTSLAKLIASDLGTGLVELSGVITLDEVRPILLGMAGNDVLFIDEIHQMVSGGRVKAEWLLNLLQDGALVTSKGVEEMPKVTVIAATTDAQRLPETILTRFFIKPVLEPYTLEEGALIGQSMAGKLGYGSTSLPMPSRTCLTEIAQAANCSPRDIKGLLVALRDAVYSHRTEARPDYNIEQALDWAGLTPDGLTRLAQDYLTTLATTFQGRAGERTLANALGEPGPLRHTEQLLVQKGYVTVGGSGRELTHEGMTRAVELLEGGSE